MATGEPIIPPLPHTGSGLGPAFNPDGSLLGTLLGEYRFHQVAAARLWDAATGQPVSPPLIQDFPETFPTGGSFSFAPDGRYVATGGPDHQARIWAIRRAEASSDDLMALAELIGGRRLDRTNSLIPLTAEEMTVRWQALQERHRALFTTTERQVSSWHRRQAAAALWHGAVPAAAGHLRTDPDRHVGLLDAYVHSRRLVGRREEQQSLLRALAEALPESTELKYRLLVADPRRFWSCHEETATLLEQVVADRRATRGDHHPATLEAQDRLASAYRGAQSIALHEEILAARKATLGESHFVTLAWQRSLASAYSRAGRFEEAIALFEELLAMKRRVLGEDHPETLSALGSLATTHRTAGRLDEAVALLEEQLAMSRRAFGEEGRTTLSALHALGWTHHEAGRFDEAIHLFEQLLAVQEARLGDRDPEVALLQTQLGHSLLKRGDHEPAEPLLRQALETRRELRPNAWYTFNTQSLLGEAVADRGDFTEGEALLLAAFEEMKSRSASIPDSVRTWRLAEAAERLVGLYRAWDKPEEAEAWKEKLAQIAP